jgi:transcriptional regulator with XRE-family HTH domain
MFAMAGREPDIGATAKTVAENVKRLREKQNLSYTQLSDRLQRIAGWSINAVGVRRIEAGERRVNVDDLMALAVALEVSPETLLMPYAENADDQVRITGWEPMDASEAWRWMQTDTSMGYREFPPISAERALPPFVYRRLMEEKMARLPELKAEFERRKRKYAKQRDDAQGGSDGDA